ncbi:large ribosomal subunit protein uL5 [Rhinolophus sinicus]|uniref:large ribosomal subunit protein uL5 n=1 Tax=Rhinolophus sinicus TaxID=89399 RepID=UPI003D7B793C
MFAVLPSTCSCKHNTQGRVHVVSRVSVRQLCLHICVGKSGDRLTRAAKGPEQLPGQTPVFSKARHTVRSFGIRRNERIAVHCTVRGATAEEILEKVLKVQEYELRKSNFSDTGNFGLGIQEHIDLGIRYDPSIGIDSLGFCVLLGRPGFSIADKKHREGCPGAKHRVCKEEVVRWFQQKSDGIILSGISSEEWHKQRDESPDQQGTSDGQPCANHKWSAPPYPQSDCMNLVPTYLSVLTFQDPMT